MSASSNLKDPAAVLDFPFDWSDWLTAGEAITVKVVTPSTGIVVDSSSIVTGTDSEGNSVASGGVLVWLSGGTHGVDYTVACKITTSQGRTDERTRVIKVRNR